MYSTVGTVLLLNISYIGQQYTLYNYSIQIEHEIFNFDDGSRKFQFFVTSINLKSIIILQRFKDTRYFGHFVLKIYTILNPNSRHV